MSEREKRPPRLKPFVTWVGSKRTLLPEIEKRLPDNISNYYEPFVGGGSVFFALSDRIRKGHLSDTNSELILAYYVISQNVDALIPLLKEHKEMHEKSHQYYYQIRKYVPSDPVKATSRFIYLMKTCFRGRYDINSRGLFNNSRGNRKNIYDPDNLRGVSQILQQKAQISCLPFESVTPSGVDPFVFLDPPYVDTYRDSYYKTKGKRTFDFKDQCRLVDYVDYYTKRGVKFMVTNTDNSNTRKLYKRYNIHSLSKSSLQFTDNKGTKGVDECIITNY